MVVDPARAAALAAPVAQNAAAKPAPARNAKKANRNKKRREARPAKTLEDLDAEMEGTFVLDLPRLLEAGEQC